MVVYSCNISEKLHAFFSMNESFYWNNLYQSYPDVDESDEILLGSTNMSSTDLADLGRRDPSSR